ncbi:hypothetical protein KY290_030719 [Solanum tuberosum]|uniref:Uncharacterized protein n=1 Tax=Solanum tuberosum TaxID=4113 RepID=A0ABQ7U8R0_SOLTU|nr:hypothetical protein KY290_030719 [Solanum tuberosum]
MQYNTMKRIRKGWQEFQSPTQVIVGGNGRKKIRTWIDPWLDFIPLKQNAGKQKANITACSTTSSVAPSGSCPPGISIVHVLCSWYAILRSG